MTKNTYNPPEWFKLLCIEWYKQMLTDIIIWLADKYGLVMTESYRRPYHTGDVHSTDPVRAVDIRSHCYDGDKAHEIMNEINAKWEYDSNRPHMKCAIIHDVGKGVHFHIQVHPNTIRIKSK